jgi:glycerophosphoryl diester phosphodiesterase
MSRWGHRPVRVGGWLVAGCLLAVVLIWAPVELGFRVPVASPVPDGPHVWAHRGSHGSALENTLEAFRTAFGEGATGIELDLYYEPLEPGFVVAHDYVPGAPRHGRLMLDDVVSALGPAGYYWLDLKNLSAGNRDAAAARLAETLDAHGALNLAFVETSGLGAARALTAVGLRTIYSVVNPYRVTSLRARWLTWAYYTLVVATTDVEGLSVEVTQLDDEFQRRFGHLPFFVYTVNDDAQMARTLGLENVNVVLSDRPYWRE